MPSFVFWTILVWTLFLSTFGIWFCTLFVMSTVFFIFGFLTMMYVGQDIHAPSPFIQRKNTHVIFFTGIPKVANLVKHPKSQSKQDQRLTGSVRIDEPLQEIIHYIFRDYIYTWYRNVSSDEEFVFRLRDVFKNILNNIARSSIEVDWVSFFTRHVVDDFASHLRLYRQSEKALKKCQKEQSEKYTVLESAFFDLELSMEKDLCRDIVCTSVDAEKSYLLNLSDLLLYLFLPPEEFRNENFRFFLRDILCHVILFPTISSLADPDFINQNLIWACKDHLLSSKAFISVIRRTDSVDELSSVMEIAKHEMKVQKAKDTGDKEERKQYTKSISFVHELASLRRQKLLTHNTEGESDSIDLSVDIEWKAFTEPEAESKLIVLPFDIVLNNNVGLHYFTEFMTSINAQGYVFFYHNIEGFRATVESILSSEEDSGDGSADSRTEVVREFALQLFDTYFGENAAVQVKLDESLLKKIQSRINTERITENFFDDIQMKVYKIMEEEFYQLAFKVSKHYIKLLAELDLLPDLNNKDDETSTKSDDLDKSESSPSEDIVITQFLDNEVPSSEFCFPETPVISQLEESKGDGILTAEVYSTGITHHAGKTFAVYAIAVNYQQMEGPDERWFVVRRYSEFYEFHKLVIDKFPILASFDFPSKKAFNNLSRHLMEKRRHMLNEFLQYLLSADVLEKCENLQMMVYNFLEPTVCDKEKKSLVRTVGTIINPIRTSVKTVGSVIKLVPNTLFGLRDGLVKALKTAHPESQDALCFETDRVAANIDLEAEDIPLRIVLLLLDEIFDLKSKDLWFRRRIMFLIKQIIKTTHGDAINRRLTDYIDAMFSAPQLAEWIKSFSHSFWPGGIPAAPQQERDDKMKMRTRVAAKAFLLCCVPDELKHIIGSESSFKGAMTVFSLFQHPSLNRRLIYVLLESFLVALFPQNNIAGVIKLLHSKSPRTAPLTPLSKEHFGSCKSLDSADPCKASSSNPSAKRKSRLKLAKKEIDGYLSKRRSSWTCISEQDGSESVKPVPKRKKSIETSIFYTDVIVNDKSGASHKAAR